MQQSPDELLIADIAIQQHKIEYYHSLNPSVSTSLSIEQLIEKLLREKQVKQYKDIAIKAIIKHKSQLDKEASISTRSKLRHSNNPVNTSSSNYRTNNNEASSSSDVIVVVIACIVLIWLGFVMLY